MKSSVFKSSCVRGLALLALSVAFVPSAFAGVEISEQAKNQIAEMSELKQNFSAAQKKVSSDIILSLKASRGELSPSLSRLVGRMHPEIVRATSATKEPNRAGVMVRVEVAGVPSGSLRNLLRASGAVEIAVSDADKQMTVDIPVDKVEAVAAHPDVKSIVTESPRSTNSHPMPYLKYLQGPRYTQIPYLASLVPSLSLGKIGSVTSQGYISHGANFAYAMKYRGTGVKVGVLSDSASPARVAALIASGDLPADTVVLPGQAGSGNDEGTAMMEIVHDLAPDAKLYFATAFSGVTSFANNIRALKDAGCKVIVDDVSYFSEAAFQDGPIARAVNDVTAAGVTYFSSAANDGNLTNGTSGAWEGDFVDGGAIVTSKGTGRFHKFGANTYDVLTANAGSSTVISLKWSDPLGGSSNDYDLYVLNPSGTAVVASSTGNQTGTQDPVEIVGGNFAAGSLIVVIKQSGSPRALHLGTHRGRLGTATSGAVYGHNGGLQTVSTAATYWNSAKTGVKIFTGFANPTEYFSSDGPRQIFFKPDGTPITPGNFLFGQQGGQRLLKPDITAADGVNTATPGFLPFFGTSAAAPHAGALAALIYQAVPTITPDKVKEAMIKSAYDNMAPGWDRDGGNGIAMAMPGILYAISHNSP